MRFVSLTAVGLISLCVSVLGSSAPALAGGKLLATGGVTAVEGQGGAGLNPWALITGYETSDQVGLTAAYTHVTLPNYTLDIAGVAVGINDRLEVSYARQTLSISNAVTTPVSAALKLPVGTLDGTTISQDVYGVKLKVLGNAVYDQNSFLPQIAVGAQFKANGSFNDVLGVTGVPVVLGAKHASSTDFYLALTKIFLNGPGHMPLVIDGNVRETKNNGAFGLLGYGGDKSDHLSTQFEGSAAVLLNRQTAVGFEYRTNPDNLSSTHSDAYRDLFVAFFPSKSFSLTAAYLDLGNLPSGIGPSGITKQQSAGLYLSGQAAI